MAEENIEQVIKDHLATLPEPVKKAIASFDWAREVFDIGRKHGMHVDRIADLQTEVMLVVIGLISPRDFQNELDTRIERDTEKALQIAEEVNEKVFIRIRNFMKNYYEKSDKTVTKEGIENSEKNVLKKAGISLGEEDEETPGATPSQEVEVPLSPSSENNLKINVQPQATPVAPETPTLATPSVFKTKTSTISAEGKPQGFFDPYREPVE